MNKSNFAIFNYYGKSANSGGPRGYLHNLYEGFKISGKKEPVFICSHKFLNDCLSAQPINSRCPSDIRVFLSFFKKGFSFRKEFKRIINRFDIIHVHSVEDCYCLKRFAKYRGKIILTPHMPEPLVEERLSTFKTATGRKYFISSILYRYIEKKAYKFSNAFIFPSKGAMELYFAFPGFKKNFANKQLQFLITGAPYREPQLGKSDFRKKYGLTENDYVISFIGRHNYIKGYDRMIDSFKAFKKNKIKVLVAGKISDEYPFPVDDDWIELGYISNVSDLINASDIVVVPNRNTYFDLIIVEALSLGTIVLSSNTGGNNDIVKYTNGLVLFDNHEDYQLLQNVLIIKNLSSKDIDSLRKENKDFFNNYCSLDRFSDNYLSIVDSLSEKLASKK